MTVQLKARERVQELSVLMLALLSVGAHIYDIGC
jgi:hypothetical protein